MRAATPALAVEAQGGADTSPGSEVVSGALFNPFAGAGVAAPRPAVPQAQGGDLGLPLLAALAGSVCVVLLVRKFLD